MKHRRLRLSKEHQRKTWIQDTQKERKNMREKEGKLERKKIKEKEWKLERKKEN